MFLPRNLEAFLQSLSVYNLVSQLPNPGQKDQYSGVLVGSDEKNPP